jgi:hypothetical protein
MVVWLWWQENHEKRGKVEEMPQPSVDVSSISLPMCFFCLHQHFFLLKKLALSFLKCLMLIWLWWQENDEQTVKDEIPEASADVSISLLIFAYTNLFF